MQFGGELVDGRLTNPTLLLRTALLVQNHDPRTILTGIGPAWSLAVEVVFYLVLPLLAWPASRLVTARGGKGSVVLALAPPAFLLLVGLAWQGHNRLRVPSDRITDGWGYDLARSLERSFFVRQIFSASAWRLPLFTASGVKVACVFRVTGASHHRSARSDFS
jgi:peptidoglycan/LPS O-acetylase OafA/YrhL